MAATPQPPDWDRIAEQFSAAAAEAAEVAVGLGILGINRVQALRRQLEIRLAEAASSGAAGSDPPPDRADHIE